MTLATVEARRSGRSLALLCLTAVGIVYGDIGTSPLYAVRECFFGPHSIPVTRENILGVLSLIIWTLVIVVTLKYHVYVLRADNEGEGGILALMALATRTGKAGRATLVALGLFGAALLYGDGMITPAISVLGAMEGLSVAAPTLTAGIVPLTIVVLVLLFLFQRKGTTGVGVVFGPVILIWFATLIILGVVNIMKQPSVLAAFDPTHAVGFFMNNGISGYLVLGAVFLVATGGEALYADLGHFGEAAIQIDWFFIVAPSLTLNYLGQGALLLSDPGAADNPFYRMAPQWALYPLLILATMATVIASQAVISGVFSLTRQAVQLGFAPRMEIVHTSSREIGQIYVPLANWGLMLATIGIVLGFRSSSNVAAAYGVAVTTTMIITTLLAYVTSRRVWKWRRSYAIALTGLFLAVDLAFFGANIIKVEQGGWFPLLVAAIVFAVFATWKQGRNRLSRELASAALPPTVVIDDIQRGRIVRVSGTAVYLTGDQKGTPSALLHNIKHCKVVHERNVFLTVLTEDVPHVSDNRRVSVAELGGNFHRIIVRYGFMEDPNVPEVLSNLSLGGAPFDMMNTTFLMSRNNVLSKGTRLLSHLRDRFFVYLMRNALQPTEFFHLPANRVIEIGKQIVI